MPSIALMSSPLTFLSKDQRFLPLLVSSMAKLLPPPPNDQMAEEDFIDMDFTTSTPRPMEFEFHLMAAINPSPADELFYKGKLLPLHLPPRLQMVEQIEKSTPYESCNVSASPSCCVSGELNPEEYFHDCLDSNELVGQLNTKKSWTKKIKLKLKSFFGKPKLIKNLPRPAELDKYDHRKSFSGGNESNSNSKSDSVTSSFMSSSKSSSFSSVNSNESCGQQLLKRSSSVSSDVESSIQGAIAYCKRSHLEDCERKVGSGNVGFRLISVSKVVPD